MTGLNLGYYFGWSPIDMRSEYEGQMRDSMAELLNWFGQDLLNPRVSHLFPLCKFQTAMETVLNRQALGRVALVMDEEKKFRNDQ